jgi:sugar O-acyltransferase (sialic acid O-acetyltransferase NeuD family)
MPTQRLLIWGAAGHASVVADIVRAEERYQIAGMIDDLDPQPRQLPTGMVLGGCDELPKLLAAGVRHIIIGIGDNTMRRRCAAYAQEIGFELVGAVHPRATLAAGLALGAGTVVMAGAVINPGARIGSNVIINTCASVDHDCVLADGIHVCPGTHLAGNVTVGEGTFIGIGSAVRERVRIGAECVVGAGSVVVSDLPDRVLSFGCPARVVRTLSSPAV